MSKTAKLLLIIAGIVLFLAVLFQIWLRQFKVLPNMKKEH